MTPRGRLARWLLTLALLGALGELALCAAGSVDVCRLASLLGEEAFYVALGILIYTLFSGGFGLRLVSSLTLTAALTVFLKTLLKMPRPPENLWLAPASGPGFPSGHAAMSTAFWLLLTLYTRSPLIAALGLLHTTAVAYSRIALHVHYPADVIGGVVVALALNALLFSVWRRTDSIAYTVYTSLSSLTLSALAVALMPGYESAWKLLGISLGLLAASLLLLPGRVKLLAAIENGLPSLRLRLTALAYTLLWAIPAALLSQLGELGGMAGYLLLSLNAVASRPLIYISRGGRGRVRPSRLAPRGSAR